MIGKKRTQAQHGSATRQTLLDYLSMQSDESLMNIHLPETGKSSRYRGNRMESWGYLVLVQPVLLRLMNPLPKGSISAREGILALIAYLEDLNNLAPSDLSDFQTEELLDIARELYLFSRENGYDFINEEIRRTIEELERNYYGYGAGMISDLLKDKSMQEQTRGMIDVYLPGTPARLIHLVIIETEK